MVPNMKLALVLAVLVACCSAAPNGLRQKRQLKFEDVEKINVDAYLQNKRAVDLQIQCLAYDGPCDPLGRWLKDNIRVFTHKECPQCDHTHYAKVDKIVEHLEQNYPDEWKIIQDKA